MTANHARFFLPHEVPEIRTGYPSQLTITQQCWPSWQVSSDRLAGSAYTSTRAVINPDSDARSEYSVRYTMT